MKKMNPKQKKIIIILIIIISVLLLGWIIWSVWLEKLYIMSKNEKIMLDASVRYYELNSGRLPIEDNGVSTVSLKTLYDEKYIKEAFYLGKTSKLCDASMSWTKVRKEDGQLKYYVYLKCGKLESNVDHTGPTITLNGDTSLQIDHNSEYEDAGVKNVVDKGDGQLEVANVRVSGKVDTTKIGTYTITYTAYDNLKNKSQVKRVVKVVDMLNTVTKNNTENGYYKGSVGNNYVLFSGMLFRVVGVNSDNTTKVISAYPVSNMIYNSDNNFENSDIKNWLNKYFYEHLSTKAKKYVYQNSTWCNDNLTTDNLNSASCSKESKKMPVGLLSIQEFNRSLDGDYASFLQSEYIYWLINRKDKDAAWASRDDFLLTDGSNFLSFTSPTALAVRPVLNLVSDIAIIGGSGTESDPYLLSDYSPARVQSKLNTRFSGEYVIYSGYLFRIVEVDDDGTTKVVMDTTLSNDGQDIQIKYDNGDNDKIYNAKQKGNIAYQINNKLNQYINTDLFVKKEIDVPIYKTYATYEANRVEHYTVKLFAPDMFELFSARNTKNDFASYWYRNSSKQANTYFVMANAGNIYTQPLSEYKTAGVKLSAYFKDNVKITSGSGTREDPYYVK